MNELKKYKLLLSLLTILVFAKFIIVPIFLWQEQLVHENRSKEKKLIKITNVLTTTDKVDTFNQTLANLLAQAEKLFFPHQSDSDFKLNQQQMLEGLFNKYNLRTNNFGWQTSTELKKEGLKRYQVNIRFDGNFVDIIAMYTNLESLTPWLEIDNFNISTKGQQKNALGYIKGGRVTVNLYMQNIPATASNL